MVKDDLKPLYNVGDKLTKQHGGEGALKRLQRGEEFTGIAKAQEIEVERELEERGRFRFVRRNAIRVQVCADLFWGAIVRLVDILEQRGDADAEVLIVKLDKLVARFGWLAGVSLRAWQQVKEEEPEGGHPVDYEVLLQEMDSE